MKIAVASLLLAILFAYQATDKKVIRIGEGIQHDDYVYSVLRVDTTVQPTSLKPDGRLWVVTFQVKNEAKLIAHDWSNKTAYITDSTGTIYESQSHETRRTPAGKTDHVLLLFDLPKTVKKPYLQVRGETLMGDVFNGWQYEKTKIRLF